MEPVPTVIVGEITAGRAAAVRKQLLLLSEDLKERTFDLAEILFGAVENRLISQWGYGSLGEYSETELDIKERRARYLVRIVRVCKAAEVSRTQYEPLGVTKLREITALDPDGEFYNKETGQNEPLLAHIKRLLRDANFLKVSEITDEVKRLKGQTGENEMIVRSYSVTRSCWDNTVKRAMEKARQLLGSQNRDEQGNALEYSDGAVLECICANFLADPNNAPEPVAAPEVEDEPLPVPSDLPLEFEGTVQLNSDLLKRLAEAREEEL